MLDRSLREIIRKHPDSVIVNMGAGFDDRFSRVDNGRIRWFDIDLPDMICARIELGTPSAQRSDWEINTDTENSVTISGTISGTTTCKLLLVQAESGTAS